MDKVDTFFAMVGFLTTAYLLGYLVEVLLRPFTWLARKFSETSAYVQQLNAHMDAAFGGKPPEFPGWKALLRR